MSDSSDDEYMSLPGSFPYDHVSGPHPSTLFDTWSRDDEDFSRQSAFARSSDQRFGGNFDSRAPSVADYSFQGNHHFGRTFPVNGPDPPRASMPFQSFFDEGRQVRPFPPPRADMALVQQRRSNSIDWVSKLNLWDQAQKVRTESKYEFRQLDNGDHIAQVNVAGSGRIFQGIAKKKIDAKQQAAMGACEALRLRIADRSEEQARDEAQFSKTLTEIYEGLFATSLLQNPRVADVSRGPSFNSFKSTSTWHRFLDELCQLCQFDKGASNTTSIALERAECVEGAVTFWLATNTGSKLEMEGARNQRIKHLERSLKKLRGVSNFDDWEREREKSKAVEAIFSESVKFSKNKIHNYQEGLRRFVMKALPESKERSAHSSEDNSLYTSLEILMSKEDHARLCDLAYNFPVPSSKEYEVLKSKINRTTEGTWKEIKHFLGRLGSVKRAAVLVVSNANLFSEALQNFRVSCVEVEPTTHETNLDGRHGLSGILQRVCPRLNEGDLLNATAEKMKRATGVTQKLTEGPKKTVVHAETAMAHHFYTKDLKVLYNDHYIGCSKPSCYACTLYLTEHPGRFHPRQTSGNAYIKWAPPLRENEDLSVNGATMRTLRSMMKRMDSDILESARNRSFAARPQFDSTTGRTLTRRAITVAE